MTHSNYDLQLVQDAAYADNLAAHPDVFALKRDDEGFTTLPLHEVARIFGLGLSQDNPDFPIEMEFRIPLKHKVDSYSDQHRVHDKR